MVKFCQTKLCFIFCDIIKLVDLDNLISQVNKAQWNSMLGEFDK